MECTKKVLELVSEDSKFTEYMLYIKKSMVFLCIRNKK